MIMASSKNDGPCIHMIIQQCLSARLQVQPPTDEQEAEYVEVSELNMFLSKDTIL
jgi:hypothetical protein